MKRWTCGALGAFALSILAAGAAAEEAVTPSLTLTLRPSERFAPVESLPAQGKEVRVCAIAPGSLAIDGAFDDWPDCAWTELAGDANLSATFAVGLDRDNFYLAVRVADDVFSQREHGGDIWRGDSVQFAFDPLGDRSRGRYGSDDYEYGMAKVDDESILWRWQGPAQRRPGLVSEAELVVLPASGETRYELRLPLAQLDPFLPLASARPGFTLVVNDADGGERERVLEWTPGIAQSKDPSQYGMLVLPADIGPGGGMLLAQSNLSGIFADEHEEYPLEFCVAAASATDVVLRVAVRKGDETLLTAETPYRAEPGTSWQQLAVAVRGLPPSKLALDFAVLPAGQNEPVHQATYTVYKYNAALIK